MLGRLRFDLAYFFRPPWDTGVSPPELLSYISTHAPGRAVDLGCGTGTNILTLARSGWQVTGVDLSPRAMHLAEQKMKKAGVTAILLTGDLSKHMVLPGPFDLALDIGCFHAVSGRRRYLENLGSALRNGGHWLMYAFVRMGSSRLGLDGADLALIGSLGMRLVRRTDGVERSGRPSTWFLFERIAGSN